MAGVGVVELCRTGRFALIEIIGAGDVKFDFRIGIGEVFPLKGYDHRLIRFRVGFRVVEVAGSLPLRFGL